MKKGPTLSMAAAVTLAACGQDSKPTPEAIGVEVPVQKEYTRSEKNFIHTQYKYTTSSGENLVIQNSFPKSGIKYTSPGGKNYVYAVFWTRILNETARPLELKLGLPPDSVEVPASSGNYLKLLLPSDTLTFAKEPLYDYGLAVKPFLDENYRKAASLKRVVNSHESSAFYVVTLSTRGVNGPLRTGFSLKGQRLLYKINGQEIYFGTIN